MEVRGWLLTIAVTAGCGRYSFENRDADTSSGDGRGSDAGGNVDAEVFGPWGVPQAIPNANAGGVDDDPTATGDALELFFASDRGGATTGFADIYTAKRTSLATAWGAASPVVELNSGDEDQAPGVSADGLTIYFSSRRTGGIGGTMNSDIWKATRPDRTSPWSTPTVDAQLSSTLDEFEPQPDATNTRLVLYRAIGGNDKDLYEATRPDAASPWGTPIALTELNTTGAERSPFLSPDGLTIWFSSDRSSGTAGVNDIFVATRTSEAMPFGPAVAVSELNTATFDDDDPWISTDGHVMLMTSNRVTNYDVYEVRR